MSTLEKFGILVILILVVVIGVVAVWGVGGTPESDPFGSTTVASKPDLAPLPPAPWPDSTGTRPEPSTVAGGPVQPPRVDAPVTPPGGPTPTPPPTKAATKTYTVKSGDTLAGIALATLGDRNKWPLIADINSKLDPHRLRVGQVLNIPDASGVAVASAPETGTKPTVKGLVDPPGRSNPDDGPTGGAGKEKPGAKSDPKTDVKTTEYEVKAGDTLTKIAEEILHDGTKYYRIQDLNPGLDPRKLRVGQRILVPSAE